VLVVAVAVLDAGVAGRDGGPEGVLPDAHAGHGAGDPVLLGGAGDHGRPGAHGRGPVPGGVPARDGAGPSGPEDVEVAGARGRPEGGGGAVRRGGAAPTHHGGGGSGRGPAAEVPGAGGDGE